jgi:hypothetical protein
MFDGGACNYADRINGSQGFLFILHLVLKGEEGTFALHLDLERRWKYTSHESYTSIILLLTKLLVLYIWRQCK